MEGPDERAERRPSGEGLRPLAHLAGRLVGERDGRDRARVRSGADEPRQPVRDDAGLARAGAGEHEERPLLVEDRFALFGIQLRRKSVDTGDHTARSESSRAELDYRRSTHTTHYSTVTDFARLRG